MRVDLHLHSTVSDGAFPPEGVARRVAEVGVELAALTDHDTTAGWEPFAQEARSRGLVPLCGIELTCRVRAGVQGTVHVLGYGVDPGSPGLQELAARNRAGKRAQIQAILGALEAQGVTLAWDEVTGGLGPEAYVGRNHVAAALVRRGVVRDRRKAFRRFLQNARVPEAEVVAADDALEAIHAAGGLSVLAHPTRLDLEHHLGPLSRAGLRGLEVYRPRAVGSLLERVERAAVRRGLLPSAGSDWHGHAHDPQLGQWKAPQAPLEPLLAALGLGEGSS
ncbi:MAG: PHP domain-containing protein [Planctomycetota bacterium]